MIEIKSFNQILGNMVRKIVAETPLNDVNPGSVFLSLLEACASNDFENNAAILSVLELLNVDSTRNRDLDNKAAEYGLTRLEATTASGFVTIYNTNIKKQSSSLYSLKPAPIAGQTTLFVTNTQGWANSGSLYIGRGTNSFEGPIAYTSITRHATYSEITLDSALQKDHLSSDTVIAAQGQPDRIIPANTTIKIPANNQSAEIRYVTVRDAIIPAGEDKVENVLVVAQTPGVSGNALIGTIKQFESEPFVGAAVSNTQAFTSGRNAEKDSELRNRIKSYAASLARGTSPAILSAVIGLSDPDDNKRVASAVLANPVTVGSPSILYVDDGTGFEPSFSGQAVDTLVARANGSEDFLQLSNYPLPRAQVINSAVGPFLMVDRSELRVAVDSIEESVVFRVSDFVNITVATAAEIVSAINDKAELFKARLTNSSKNILLYPVDPMAETIQVMDTSTANSVLEFPTKENSYIALYQNNTRLRQRAQQASVETVPFALWSTLGDGNLIISVDGTPSQNGAFSLSDFPGYDSFSLITLDSWVAAFNNKFAGITASATPSGTMKVVSNKVGSSASIEILGGSYLEQMFVNRALSSTGRESDFEINRQTGNVRILTEVTPGDIISAGVADAKGYVTSSSTASGTYNLDVDDSGRESQMVVVVDPVACKTVAVNLQIGDLLTVSNQSSGVMRITASTATAFSRVQPGDYIYITKRASGGFADGNIGLFKVASRGGHTTAGIDSYIEAVNLSVEDETVTIIDVNDVTAFSTDGYPQVWRGAMLSSAVNTTLPELIDSLNKNLLGVKATVFRSSSVKLTSTTETDGSIAVPVSIGRVSGVFAVTTDELHNNPPLVANKQSDADLVGFPKLDIKSGNSYLANSSYPLVDGVLTADEPHDEFPYSSTYSEELTSVAFSKTSANDIAVFTSGDNKGVTRSIAAKTATDSIGTQHSLPRTAFDHVVGDEVTVFQSLRFGADDSIICVMDNDATSKTIDIGMARTGKVNTGSGGSSFIPTTTEFSADDVDNEPGIDFSSEHVWGTDLNGTDFSDYAVLMQARNWYSTGGTTGGGGILVLRANEFGPNGNSLRFRIAYPSDPGQSSTTAYSNNATHNTLSYIFGSGAERSLAIAPNTEVNVAVVGGNECDLTFSTGLFSTVQVGDVLSFKPGSGVDTALLGQFRVLNVGGNTLRVYNANGVVATYIITNPSLVHVFPLTGTSTSDIAATVNDSDVITASVVSAGEIATSTKEDIYTFSTDATALAHNHTPGQDYIELFDGINWIKAFSNDNPNFTVKVPFELTSSGVSPTIYSLNGEQFKLVPTTAKNIRHHLNQKALSQLPILSTVGEAGLGNKIQIVSKELGSKGGVQIVGGLANAAEVELIGDSQVAVSDGNNYLQVATPAHPNAFNVGDIVKFENKVGVRRSSKLDNNSTVSVEALGDGFATYLWDERVTNFTTGTSFSVEDVSSEYQDINGDPLAPGMIFRWVHTADGGETLAGVKVGDLVAAYGMNFTVWPQGNCAKTPGAGKISGLPIIKVDDVNHSFDVVSPFGKNMALTPVTGTVSIFPTPHIKFNLAHVAATGIDTISRTSNVVTVICSSDHCLNTGDSVRISDSIALSDDVYGPVTVTSPTTFSFTSLGSDFNELNVGATAHSDALTPTRYRIEKMGINNLVKVVHAGGAAPRFADAGVAVDDYIRISGNTFSNLNSGTFRVVAVSNSYIVFENAAAVNETNTLKPFNKNDIAITWTANSNVLTGLSGAFKHLAIGDWVKKDIDPDSRYLQVVASNTGDFATATRVELGNNYSGISGIAAGVAYNQLTGYNAGVELQNADDITILDGDSALVDDTLFVQNIVNTNWFSINNTGSFAVVETGSNPSDHRPMVRVRNSAATTQTNRNISVNLDGFYLVEGDANRYKTYRQVVNSTIDENDTQTRRTYLIPDSRSYKLSQANNTVIKHVGKLGFNSGVDIGTDGYSFYTGLLRRVQRTVDGYAPDLTSYPERRAVGSWIETLPPLIKNITIALTVTTHRGSTVQDVSNNVKSAIIDYVNGLGVGEDVILSSIIARVMQVGGVAATTFNVPHPTEERISISTNEKAVITADNIGIN